ncbi:MAG: hypothetical protein HQ566_00470 [Candidatus Omnitrophica bacterium]|nr:hypothetical protein [Candidatus Omnitrophota bacterium]
MRRQIVRHNIRLTLLVILLFTAFVSVVPWIYENVFIHEDGIVLQTEIWQGFDLSDFSADEPFREGISLDATFLNNGYVLSKWKIREVDLKGLVFSADLIVKGRFIRDEEDRVTGFSGKLLSRDAMLNAAPFMPLRMSFKIEKDTLEVRSLRLGNAYEVKGRCSLERPFNADLRLEINRADIREITKLMKVKNPDVAMGILNGTFCIKGPFATLFSDGMLESRNGKLGPIEYDLASVRLEGFGPIINIVDSNIRYGNSNLTVDGYVDLRNLAKGELFSGLRVKSDMKRIVWDGWDITKKGKDELSMEKAISDKVRVGFKTMSRDPITRYYHRDNPEELSLEYKMGMENLKMKLKEDEEFFGIEHNIEF